MARDKEDQQKKPAYNMPSVSEVRFYNIQSIARQRNLFLALCLLSSLSCALLALKLWATAEKVVMIPGINQEAWTSSNAVSGSYLEEATVMYLPFLLDLDGSSIECKKSRVLRYVSQSDSAYLKELSDYFERVKEQYKQFSLSTYFHLKRIESNPQNLTVKIHGELISRFGSKGFESHAAIYGINYEWLAGKLLIKRFVKLSEEELESFGSGDREGVVHE